MLIFKNYHTFSAYRDQITQGKKVGFVPTMGALHHGHLNLVEHSINSCDHTVVSIYVNARQFNDPEDFKKYPRLPEKDISLLEKKGVSAVFLPDSEEELYKADKSHNLTYDLKGLDLVLEGAFRQNHFNAVVEVVERLFAVVRPTHAFFGLKDYQQYKIISHFVDSNQLPVNIVGIETVREEGGLAMSSRNERLSSTQREEAKNIFAILSQVKIDYTQGKLAIDQITTKAINALNKIPSLSKIDYLKIVKDTDLQEIKTSTDKAARVFVAAHFGSVRLIDNLSLNH